MKALVRILFALLLASGIGSRLDAQVTIVRAMPPSSAPEVQAQWSAPQPGPQAAIAAARTQLSGQVSLGGSAGRTAPGDLAYGFLTDSRIRLVQPFGPDSALQLDAKAVRKNLVDGVQQAYAAEMALLSEKLSLSAAGTFTGSERIVGGSSETAMDAAIKASASTTIMPALPMSLDYLHNWKQGEGATDAGLPVQTDSLKLSSVGAIGRVGVELSGAFDRGVDSTLDLESLGTSGRLQLTVPALPFLAVLARLSPGAARTTYTSAGGTTASTSLESNLGLLLLLADAVRLSLIAGRVDTWASAEGMPDEPPPYQLTWNGELGAEVRNRAGFSASPAWKIAKTVGGNLSNTLSLSGAWTAEEQGLLKEARLAAELSLVNEEGGGFLESEDTWSAAVALTPVEKMSLSASYSGSLQAIAAEVPSWSHKASVKLGHEPAPILDYRATAAITGRSAASGAAVTQEYAAAVNLKPRWGERTLLFGLAETVSIADLSLSKASYAMAIPVVPAASARYGFEWEWIDQTMPGGAAGHAFRHLFGVEMNGERLPVRFSAEYAFSHGYRGFRHDVNACLQFPFSRTFVLESALALSSFEESGAQRFPMLFSLGLAYRF